MASDIMEWDACPKQHVRQVLGAMNTVIVAKLDRAVSLIHGEKLLGIPDDDEQTSSLQCGQRKLARRIAQQQDEKRVGPCGFQTSDDRLDVMRSKHGMLEEHVGLLFKYRQ